MESRSIVFTNENCIGCNKCINVCSAIGACISKEEDGKARIVVDGSKCVACGQCVDTCPKHLIELIPYDTAYMVKCSSTDKGKDVMSVCAAGCIGCGICEKACNFDAVHVVNNVAHIDPEKCKGCGLCSMKCPKKVIINTKTGKAKEAPKPKTA